MRSRLAPSTSFTAQTAKTEQYYAALNLEKVPTAMVRIPDAPHGIAGRPSNLLAKVGHILAWFERYRNSTPVISQ